METTEQLPAARCAEPPHLAQARLMVTQLCQRYEKDPTPGLAALDIAAECFRRSAQIGPAQQARADQRKAEEELARVSRKLQIAEQKLARVESQRPQHIILPAQPSEKLKAVKLLLDQAKGTIGSLRHRIKELEDAASWQRPIN